MRHPLFYKKISDEAKEILTENNSFYKKLSKSQKKLFEHRIVRFIQTHHFVPKDSMQIDQKVKLLIAGTAIMLSFGFDDYLYSMFDTILVYPKDYFSLLTHQRHKGETNPQLGVVVFSWEDFKAGIVVEDDNINLGLHEFTHALHFGFKKNDTNEAARFLSTFNKLLSYITDKKVQKRLLESPYIRVYAYENQYEFLAVLVEHFYETPNDFKTKFPQIFLLLGKLLRFDRIY